jgi:NCS2 family nucleobase:cation symporter-2
MTEPAALHLGDPPETPEGPSSTVVRLPSGSARRRPSSLIYAVDERPPARHLVLLGLQHMAVVTSSLVIPLLVARAAGVDSATLPGVLAMSMLAIGIASLIQAFPLGRFGSGYLVPGFCSVNYFPASMLAATAGGMPLVYGLTILAGCLQIGLATALRRLRFLFPPEVAGVTVALVGLEAGFIALDQITHPGGQVGLQASVGIGLATFGVAAAISVFGGAAFRLYAALIGMAAGAALAASVGVISTDAWQRLVGQPWLALPTLHHLDWSFSADPVLLVAFALAAFASTLKTIGAVSTAQRLNDADWTRPDAGNLQRGVLGDGLGSICAGLIGGTGQNSATSAVGISGATGATSRWIALALALWLLALACMPKIATLLDLLPAMVIGGVLLFAAIYMFVNGIELIGSRVLDKRRTMVVGTAIIAATSHRAVPELSDAMPLVLQPLTSSGLALGMTIAVVLNLLFRIGIRRSASLTVAEPVGRLDVVGRFLTDEAGRWGLRQDVLDHALMAVGDILREKSGEPQSHHRLTLDANYDELRLSLLLRSATDRPVDVDSLPSSQPRRWVPVQVPGADNAAVQHRPGMTCLRLEFDV